MKAKILKSIKGLRKDEILPMLGFSEIFYKGRRCRSVLLSKTMNGGEKKTIEIPLESVDLISDQEGSFPTTKKVLKT